MRLKAMCMNLLRGSDAVGILAALLFGVVGTSCRSPFGQRADLPPLRLDPSAPFAESPVRPKPLPEAGSGSSSTSTTTVVREERSAGGELPPSAGGASYRLRPGDSLVVTLRTVQSEQYEMVVDENGDIKLPFIGTVCAAGLTASELSNRIEREYLDKKIYRFITAHVTVPTRSYFVRGEVRNPGRFPLYGSVTVLQAIAAAGGYTDFADITDIRLTRGDKTYRLNGKEIERNPEKDIEVEAGDVIVVKRSWY